MRNPGRSDAGDARSDRNDARPSAEAGDVGVPADGDAAFAHDPEPTPDAPRRRPGRPAVRPVVERRADRPRRGARGVRADGAALGGGGLDAARELVDTDDPLIAMLAAWAASARPDEPRNRASPTGAQRGRRARGRRGGDRRRRLRFRPLRGHRRTGRPDAGRQPVHAADAAPPAAAAPSRRSSSSTFRRRSPPPRTSPSADPAPRPAATPAVAETPVTEAPAADTPAVQASAAENHII